MQSLFREYTQIINDNNGINELESLNNWNKSYFKIIQISQSIFDTNTTTTNNNIIENIKEMSSEIKWKLISPIQLYNDISIDQHKSLSHHHVVLDILSIKIEMMKVAIYTTKLILQSQ